MPGLTNECDENMRLLCPGSCARLGVVRLFENALSYRRNATSALGMKDAVL